MSGETTLALTACGADVRRRRAEADVPHPCHQAGRADSTVLAEQRTTRCDGQALMASACNALFFSYSCQHRARVAAKSLAGCPGELCRSRSRELEKTPCNPRQLIPPYSAQKRS